MKVCISHALCHFAASNDPTVTVVTFFLHGLSGQDLSFYKPLILTVQEFSAVLYFKCFFHFIALSIIMMEEKDAYLPKVSFPDKTSEKKVVCFFFFFFFLI